MKCVDVDCSYCQNTVSKTLKEVNRNNKLGHKLYCSAVCYKQSRIELAALPKAAVAECSVCGADVHRDSYHVGRNKSGLYFCSVECRYGGERQSSPGRRASAFKLYGAVCGCGERREYCLTVHHKDGNQLNNDPMNWEVVCGCCHMTRHLKWSESGWKLDFSSLTPREMLSSL